MIIVPPSIYHSVSSHLITLDPGPLLQPGEHHDGGAPLLPHKPPEVSQSLWQRTLKVGLELEMIFMSRL